MVASRAFTVAVELEPPALVRVRVKGDLESYHAAPFDVAIEEALRAEVPAVVIHCEELTFVDSSGLRCLLQAQARTEAAGKSFGLERPCALLTRLLDITGLSERFPIISE